MRQIMYTVAQVKFNHDESFDRFQRETILVQMFFELLSVTKGVFLLILTAKQLLQLSLFLPNLVTMYLIKYIVVIIIKVAFYVCFLFQYIALFLRL